MPAPAPRCAIDPDDIARRWRKLRDERPGTRARDGARLLGVSEGALVASACGDTVVRLVPDWKEILHALPSLGRVMALTRNDAAIHERHGSYEEVSVSGPHALVLGPDIDLRLFIRQWDSAFAVVDGTGDAARSSLQIFDKSGAAVHEVYAGDRSATGAYGNLVARFAAADQTRELPVEPPPAPRRERPDEEVPVEALRSDWRALRDTHDFNGILQRHDVGRQQAIRLAGREFADPASARAAPAVLLAAAAREVPIMVFVGNRGAIQIHTGTVRKLGWDGPWFNVLDPDFSLHLRADLIASAWVVRKPTDDGVVTSLELFDSAGEVIAYVFGARKPGHAESEAWRALLRDEVAGASSSRSQTAT